MFQPLGIVVGVVLFVAAYSVGEDVECGAEGGDLVGEGCEGAAVAPRWRCSSMTARRVGSR
jgi:hypothetical protein